MRNLLAFLQWKPPFFLFISLGYLVLVYLFIWNIHPTLNAFLFLGGGCIGIFFLEAAEHFFHLQPSPFRSVVFVGLFIATSFFVITSSISFVASGLVLSAYLTILLWQTGELVTVKHLNRWYAMLLDPIAIGTQKSILAAELIFFVVQTIIFIQRGA